MIELLALAALVFPAQETRVAPPAPAAIKEAEKNIRSLFKEEYAKKSGPDRVALAKTLLENGEKTADDPAARWVLLGEARDVALQAGELDLALRACDALGRAFTVRPAALKLEAIAKGKGATGETAAAILEDAIRTNDFESAAKAAEAGRKLAGSDVALAARLAARAKEAAEMKARFVKAAKAFDALEKNPEDPAANLEAGEFCCFAKGDWELGLPMLAKGGEGPLAALARKDLEGAEEPAPQAALGDAWWDLAEKQKGELKARYADRAADWYGRAVGGLQGLDKVKLEKRLGGLPPSKAPVNLLKRADPEQDANHGTWTPKGAGFVSDAAEFASLGFPYQPPAEYDLRVTFARQEGDSDVVVFFSQGARTVCWAQGSDAGFASVKGLWHAPGNPTEAATPGAVAHGRPVTIVVEVRKDRFKVLLEGKTVKEWKTSWDDAGLPGFLKLKNPGVAVCSYKSPTHFTRVELVELSGRGRPLR